MTRWYTTFVANGFLLLSGILSGVMLARMLGVEDRGSLAALIYWPQFIVGVLAMSLNEGIVLQITVRGNSLSITKTALLLSLMLAALVSLASWWLLVPALGEARSADLHFARLYACVLAFASYTWLNLLAIEQGRLRFTHFNALRGVQALVYLTSLAALWSLDLVSVQTAAIAVLLGGVTIALVLLFKFRSELRMQASLLEAKQISRRSIKLHVVNVFMAFSDQLDRMILITWASNTQIGQYVVAQTVAVSLPSLLVQTYITVMLPAVAHADGQGYGRDGVLQSLKIMVALTIIVASCAIIAMPILLPLVFGHEYMDSVPYAQVVTLALAISGLRKCVVYLLRSWQISRPAALGEGMTTLCLVAGGYPAFVYMGVIGFCWILVASQAAGAFVVWRGFSTALSGQPPKV